MKVQVNFITPTRISLIDITSMGDSSKRGNTNTIGQFDSGLKYAIAILLRNEVKLSIYVQGDSIFHENWEEPATQEYTFSSFIQECPDTGKKKELISVDCEYIPHGGAPMSQYDMREPSGGESWTLQTGFAKALGYNWELWMALRELYSNMLDEGGSITGVWYKGEEPVEGTVMSLEFDSESEFNEVWENRHLYVNEKEPLFVISDHVQALENKEGYLRIYKQNILVYKDEKTPSRFAYNIKFGDIDERRILSDLYSVTNSIVDAIKNCKNVDFLRAIITPDFELEDGEYMYQMTVYGTAPDALHNVAIEVFEEHGKVNSFPFIMKAIWERKDCGISGKTIKSIGDHMYGYTANVKLDSKPEPIPEPVAKEVSFVDKIKQHYKFNLDVDIKQAKLIGSKVIADKHEKCIIVDFSFSIEEDMPALIVQYIDLTKTGNIIKNLSEMICELLKK